MKTIYFIDPQSYNNLGMYDYEILSRIKNDNVYFIANQKYDYLNIPNVKICKWFKYGKYNTNFTKAISYILSLLRILILIIHKRPQVIHIQWVRIPIIDFYYYKIIKHLFGVSLVYTVHNVLPHKIKKSHWRLLKSVNAKLLNSVFMLVTRFSGLQTLSHFSNDYIGVGALKLGSPIFHECRTIHF